MFEIYQGLRGGAVEPSWYWRFRADNGRVMADGAEGYVSRSNVLRALRRFHALVTLAGTALQWKEAE